VASSPKRSLRVQLDLTPWVRAPGSGIGRTARRTFEAIREQIPQVGAVARSRRIPPSHAAEVRTLGLLERGLGRPGTLHHSFEHRLPPLKRSMTLLSIHDLWTLRPGNPYQSVRFQAAQAPILKRALERADWITTPLPSVLAELHDRFPATRNRSCSIPWASTLAVRVSSEPIAGLDGLRPFVLTVAVVENRKNLVTLARALSKNTGLDWLLLGKPGFGGEKILEEIRSHFPGVQHRSELSEGQLTWAYENAEALVLPSMEEGFGLPVLEAAQFGTPLVLSRIPAFTDITSVERRDTALFFDSEKGLAEILTHLGDAPGSFSMPDPRLLLPHYTWTNTASRFIQLYRNLGFTP
jgi:glycosyltransferase involved in cell wall biosynthesis